MSHGSNPNELTIKGKYTVKETSETQSKKDRAACIPARAAKSRRLAEALRFRTLWPREGLRIVSRIMKRLVQLLYLVLLVPTNLSGAASQGRLRLPGAVDSGCPRGGGA